MSTPSPIELGAGASERPRLSRSHVQLRLMLLVLLLVCLLAGLLLALVSRVFSELTPALADDLRWKAQQGVVELSHTADLGLLTTNVELLRNATDRGARERDFLYVAFRDAEDNLIFERGEAALAPAPEKVAESLTENEHAFASWAPLTVEGLLVGSVTLAVSKQRLSAGTQLYRRFVAVGLFGATLALGLALLFVRRYIAPILRLTDRTLVELGHTAEAALASAKAKSQFLANMSHEIRTPMNGVLGTLHLVRQTELTPTQRRYLDVMAGSAKSLLTIVNDVLDISKLEADKYELAPAPCRLREVIEQTALLFQVKAQEKGLALSSQIDDAVPEVLSLDVDRLRQVLGNLLSNAVKFTSQGSVELVVAVIGRQSLADRPGSPGWLEVRITDTGIGISDASRKLLFTAFSQVDQSSSRSHEGSGLGLAISKKLVELMGGHIEHQPSMGAGSIFRFVLPLSESADEPAPEPRPGRTGALRFECERPILLVDDNEINLLVAVEILEGLGLRVDIASGGRDAIDAALRGDYALVLMDCQMPEVDGYQAAAEIRRRERGARLPIVAFTAHALCEERAKVLACGMDDIVTKPIEVEALSRVLSRWLSSAPSGPRATVTRDAELPAVSTRSLPAEELPAEELPALEGGRRRPARAVQLFLETVPHQIEDLRRAAAGSESDALRTIAHKLKGSAGSLGATRMARLCEQMQVEAFVLPRQRAIWLVEQIALAHAATEAPLAAEIARRGVK